MSNGNGGKTQNGLHDLYGFLSVAGGLLVIGALAFWLPTHFSDVKDVTAVLGTITGPVVALVSAYFGISTSSKAQAKSAANQKAASDQALASVKAADAVALATAYQLDPTKPETKELFEAAKKAAGI